MRRTLPGLVAAALVAGGVATMASVPAAAQPGTPTFTMLPAPASFPNSNFAGEPSLGVNGRTGAILYQAWTSTYQLTVDPATATPTWRDVTAQSSAYNIDPILATDRQTGRTFAGGLAPGCSVLSLTDDDGANWTPSGNACALWDHETVGAGPWHGAAPLGSSYGRAVYYCASDPNANDACATSLDGGRTFGPPVLVGAPCRGGHGHVKVSADGSAYLPNKSCDGAVSTDNGTTWTRYAIPAAAQSTSAHFDPTITTTPDNTAYEAWTRTDGHPFVARSTTHGSTWDRATDLSTTTNPPILNSTFQAATSGDNGRVAIAFLGSTTGGDAYTAGWPGVWDLYVAFTYDAGLTWTTVKASTDPVQRGFMCAGGIGCGDGRNLLDFMDANTTKDGRVVVGFADGCIAACAEPSGTASQSTSAYATVAYQTGGINLLAASDGAPDAVLSPTPGATPTLSSGPTASATPSTTSPTPSTTSPTPSTTSPSPGDGPSPSADPTADPTTTSPSATPTASDSASPTRVSAANESPSSSADESSNPTSTATSSPTASSARPRQPLTIRTTAPDIKAGSAAGIDVQGPPGAAVELRCYSRPSSSYATVRTATIDAAGRPVNFQIRPRTNTRCYAAPADTSAADPSASVVVRVHPVLNLQAVRSGVRTYTFSGRMMPALGGQLVTLYRVSGGTEIRTATAYTDGTGAWRLRRVFTGNGTYAFRVRIRPSGTNADGASAALSVAVH